MEVLGSSRNQFWAIMVIIIIRRVGNQLRASGLLPNRVEVIELLGIPGGIRTLVCVVKVVLEFVTD